MAGKDSKEDLEKKKKAYKDALKIHDNIVGIIEIYDDEPENRLRAKRAMLHYICMGIDPKEKQFRKYVNKLIRGGDDIPHHDDVYKFEDLENQEGTDGARSSYPTGIDVTDSVPPGSRTGDIEKRHPDLSQLDRGTEYTDQGPQGSRGTEYTDQRTQCSRGTENTDQGPQGSQGTENTDQGTQGSQGTENTDQGTQDSQGTENTDQGTQDSQGTENTDQGTQGSRGTENTDQGTQDSQGTENTDQGPQGSQGTENTDQGTQDSQGTENTDQGPQGSQGTESSADQGPQGRTDIENLDDFQYTIGPQRLALYIGVRQFEKRASNGESDGTGGYDEGMNREREEIRDRKEAEHALETLGFTFKSNDPRKETSKEKVDKFIEIELKDARKVDIIVLLISSHGEEVIEQDEKYKDKNVLRHRIFLEDKYLYTDELLTRFNISALKGIPKLFFIQACRSRFDAKEEDKFDVGTDISVIVQGNSEMEKDMKAGQSVGNKDISDARPRNLKPKVTKVPQPGTGLVDDTKEAKVQTNVPDIKPPVDTAPDEDTTLGSSDDIEHQKHVSDAKPRDSQPPTGTTKPIQKTGESEPKPTVDTTPSVVPQQEVPSITCIKDSLVMFASASGKEAYRRKREGGWMMQHLLKELEAWSSDPDRDLLQVLTRVIGKIAIENETNKGYKSAACLTHMLIKDVYLGK